MVDRHDVLSWLHIDDLHIARETGRNHLGLKHIVELAEGVPNNTVDFAALPGDNADDGMPGQFHLVRDAITLLPMSLHIVPEGRDLKPRALDASCEIPGAERVPKAVTARGHRCLFLDVASAGTGGSDFRLGEEQLAWAERELEEAGAGSLDAVVFMHAYPADLREGTERLGAFLARPHVTRVDLAHTHDNGLAYDGATIFMVTRPAGQIGDGPPGFSISAVNGRRVIWRFKPLDSTLFFVLVTHPIDRRPARKTSRDAPMAAVQMRVNDGRWTPLVPVSGNSALWEASIHTRVRHVAVQARNTNDRMDEDWVEPAGTEWTVPERHGDGSDADPVGVRPERKLVDTRFGPYGNGRKW